jgi:ABC-type multidrug transport system fused ATPase/permease subunit
MNAIRSYLRRVRSFLADLRLVLDDGVRKLPWLLLLMLLMTALDLLAVIAVAPFLARIVGNASAIPGLLRQYTDAWSLRMLGVVVVSAFVCKGVAILMVQRRITAMADGERARVMSRLLASFQARPYQFHLQHNSSELINSVLWYTQLFSAGILQGGLQVVANGLVLLVLAALLAWTDLSALLVLVLGLGTVLIVVAVLVRPALERAVRVSTEVNGRIIHASSQALGGLREIRLLGREEHFRNKLDEAARDLVAATVTQSSLSQLPRQVVEASMIAFLVAMVWVMSRAQGGMETVVPVLGTFATAGLRLMPATTALLSAWNGLRSSMFVVRELADTLRFDSRDFHSAAHKPGEVDERFVALELDNVHFRYPGAHRDAVHGISLHVRQGQAIGIMGRSGAGKSSLADMILGLLAPTGGVIRVNGWNVADDPRRWQAMTAYIPQAVFLIDDTLRRNIALGMADDEIDAVQLQSAITAAQLSETVAQLPNGVDTVLGERGVRLSGGQRQRVAIARALYHRRQFLVLDEATSALDTETEHAVVDAINALAGSITSIVIAHRHSTLAACDTILTLADGRIVATPKSHLPQPSE